MRHDPSTGRLATRATIAAMRAALKQALQKRRGGPAAGEGAVTGAAGRRLRQKVAGRAKKGKKHHHQRGGGGGGDGGGGRRGRGRKPPFWQDGAIKADGAPPEAHLCLSTWRGQTGVGAVPVFTACAPSAAVGGGGEEAAGAKESRAQQFAVLAAAGGTSQLQLGASDADAGGGLCVTAITDGVAW